jgi:hypothetical protein
MAEDTLTVDEREELDRLRDEKNNPPEKEVKELPNTHWLHLANGDVVESKGVSGSIDVDGKNVPVIAHYEIPQEDTTVAHQF